MAGGLLHVALPRYPASDWVGEPPEKFWHECETCGRKEFLSPEEAYEAGWDYPPAMGRFSIIGQRLCPKCLLNTSFWWNLTTEGVSALENANPRQSAALGRMLMEPRSLRDEFRNHVYNTRYYPDLDAVVVLDFDVDRSGDGIKISVYDIRVHRNIAAAFDRVKHE